VALGAELTIRWGATPIGVAHVPEGGTVAIDRGSVVGPASMADAALVVRVDARGATVERPSREPGAAEARRLGPGDALELPIAAPRGAAVYRQSGAWAPTSPTVHVAVSAGEARRRSAPSARRLLALAIATATLAHVGVLRRGRVRERPADVARRVAGRDPAAARAGRRRRARALLRARRPGLRSRPLRRRPGRHPDPHLARRRALLRDLQLDVIGPLQGVSGGDEDAPTVAWGRDDSLDRDARSASRSRNGPVSRDFASCFAEPTPRWGCAEADAAPSEARVVVGPIAVAANVPRWVVTKAVRAVVERSRACYERALADAPALTGRLDVVLRVRGEDVDAELRPERRGGGLRSKLGRPALLRRTRARDRLGRAAGRHARERALRDRVRALEQRGGRRRARRRGARARRRGEGDAFDAGCSVAETAPPSAAPGSLRRASSAPGDPCSGSRHGRCARAGERSAPKQPSSARA
jgi:hypothetical protein